MDFYETIENKINIVEFLTYDGDRIMMLVTKSLLVDFFYMGYVLNEKNRSQTSLSFDPHKRLHRPSTTSMYPNQTFMNSDYL